MYRLILSRRNSGGSSPRGPSVQWLYVIQVGSFLSPDGLQPVLRVRCVGNPRLLQMVESCREYLIEGDAVVEISSGRRAERLYRVQKTSFSWVGIALSSAVCLYFMCLTFGVHSR